jgi:hypothetical protein
MGEEELARLKKAGITIDWEPASQMPELILSSS